MTDSVHFKVQSVVAFKESQFSASVGMKTRLQLLKSKDEARKFRLPSKFDGNEEREL